MGAPLNEGQQRLLAAIVAFAATQPEVIVCRECRQELTDPKSRSAGIGPICAHKAADASQPEEQS